MHWVLARELVAAQQSQSALLVTAAAATIPLLLLRTMIGVVDMLPIASTQAFSTRTLVVVVPETKTTKKEKKWVLPYEAVV